MVTISVVIKAANIANQGITNENPATNEIAVPNIIPKMMPRKPPIWLMIKVSVKNCQAIVLLFAPSDFRIPISRVRSLTETSIMFIRAIVEPKTVMAPIITATKLITAKLEPKV